MNMKGEYGTTVILQPIYTYTIYKVIAKLIDGTELKIQTDKLEFFSEKTHNEFLKNGATVNLNTIN